MKPKKRPKAAKTPRPTVGRDPLDSLVSAPVAAATKASRRGLAPRGTTPKPPEKEPKPRKTPKARATYHLPPDLLEETRDAVVALMGPPVRLTLASLAETALRRELERLKKAHNGGKPFPRRERDLEGGRPIGS